MKRTPLAQRTLPDYSAGEELCNMLSHLAGVLLGIVVLVLCVAKASAHQYLPGIIGGTIFGTSMILLYTMSTIYHGWAKGMTKKVLQVVDHCTIYILIAGSFAPVCLTHLMEKNAKIAWIIFAIVCAACIVGVVFTAIDLKKYQLLSMVGYLSPWCMLFAGRDVLSTFPLPFWYFIVGGGVAYTIGAVLYATCKKIPYMHLVFHLFILTGSVLHFLGNYIYCF